jgi:hypothetical protein
MVRSFLLAPYLLICLACATPFPFENLETGMTAETVSQKFGAPVVSGRGVKQASSFPPKAGQVFLAPPGFITFSTWTYIHEELDPLLPPVGPMPLRVAVASFWGVTFFWVCPFAKRGASLLGPINWTCWWVSREPVVLHFEEEKLVRWELLPDIRQGTTASWQWVDDLHRMEP